MDDTDLELKLLHGSAIQIENLGNLIPLKLHQIKDIGEIEYNKRLFALTYRHPESIYIDNIKLSDFAIIWSYCYRDNQFREIFCDSTKTFFGDSVHIHDEGFFYLGNINEGRYITEINYPTISSVIKKQNFINDNDNADQYRPKDERTKELAEKMKKFKQKIKEKNSENGLGLADIISIVAAHSLNLNIFNVWDLTVYQLYTMYIRLIMKDNYESQFYLMPHVSDSSTLDLAHWARKIKNK